MIGSRVRWVDPGQQKKQKHFTNSSKMPPIKNTTKKLNKKNPIPIPKTQQKQQKPIFINFS